MKTPPSVIPSSAPPNYHHHILANEVCHAPILPSPNPPGYIPELLDQSFVDDGDLAVQIGDTAITLMPR
jgi:hypothetical protein